MSCVSNSICVVNFQNRWPECGREKFHFDFWGLLEKTSYCKSPRRGGSLSIFMVNFKKKPNFVGVSVSGSGQLLASFKVGQGVRSNALN